MQFSHLREGNYFYSIEKILDSMRQPIFRILLVAVGVCLLIVYGLTQFQFLASSPQAEIAGLQEVLSSVIGAMTTIIVTTYSIKLLLIQLTSQQFSPRVIRILLRSNARNLFFGLFIGAIISTYILKISLLSFAVEGNYLLWFSKFFIVNDLLLIAIGLPFFIYDITDSINAASIANLIYNHTFDSIKRLYGSEDWKFGDAPYIMPDFDTENKARIAANEVPLLSVQLRSHDSGYLQNVDYNRLLGFKNCTFIKNILAQHGFTVHGLYQNKMIGNFVQIEGNLLDIVLETSDQNNLAARLDLVQHALDACTATERNVRKTFKIHKYRTLEKDINLGIRQLVDIALKAISPAVNDPATAINCIDYLGTLIHILNKLPFPSIQARKWSNDYHIYIKEVIFDDIVEFAINPIYHYGRTDPTIVIRLLQTLGTAMKGSQNIDNMESLLKVAHNIIIDQAVQKPEMTAIDYEKVQDDVLSFQEKARQKLAEIGDLSPDNNVKAKSLSDKYEIKGRR
jgi:uncharacterized membrane protein